MEDVRKMDEILKGISFVIERLNNIQQEIKF